MNLNKIDTKNNSFSSAQQNDWGVMLIADFETATDDTDMIKRFSDILQAMANLKESKNLYFSFFLNLPLGLLKKVVAIPADLQFKNDKEFYTAFFNNSNILSDIFQYDLSKVSGIRHLFDMYKKNSNSKKNCLITWGDGFVYSFFSRKAENELVQKNELNSYLKQVLDTAAYDTFYNNFKIAVNDKGVANENVPILRPYSKHNLSIVELSMAINTSLGYKFDVTFMQNCGMAYYQTLITSSFYTSILIASANRVSIDSLYFPELIGNLATSVNEITADNFSQMIVSKSNNAFGTFKLSNYFKFKKLINSLGDNFIALLDNNEKGITIIQEIRTACTDLMATPTFRIVELFELCAKVLERSSDIGTNLIETCTALLKFEKDNNWTGVSIFFPQSKDDFEGISLLNIDKLDMNKLDSTFIRNHTWDYFIQKFINKEALQPHNQ